MPGTPLEEWVEKAEGDVATAARESAVLDRPNWDAACFHAQQAVEKYLKALLVREGIPFPKAHDLSMLLGLAVARHPELHVELADVNWLTFSAVEVRYPGGASTRADALRAVQIMGRWRQRLRALLGLPA